MITWAFFCKSDVCDAEKHNVVLNHITGRLLIYCVKSIEQAIELANHLIDEENCSLIELCGGFEKEGAKRLSDGISGRIGIGHVEFLPGEREKFHAYKASLGL